jgi:positive regulator of sigma E activity
MQQRARIQTILDHDSAIAVLIEEGETPRCGNCPPPTKASISAKVENAIGVHEGDEVLCQKLNKKTLMSVITMFFLPMAFMLVAYLTAQNLSLSESMSTSLSFFGFVLSIPIVAIIYKAYIGRLADYKIIGSLYQKV